MRRLNLPHLLMDAILLVALIVFVLAGKDLVPFHGDEATFLAMSRDFDVLFREGMPSQVMYSAGTAAPRPLDNIRIGTGSINAYTIGLTRTLLGMEGVPLPQPWRWGFSILAGREMWAENINGGSYPEAGLLDIARWPSTIFGAASIVVLFITAILLTSSRPAAWTTAILLASNASFLVNIRRAMQEGAKFFFVCLALCIAASILNSLKQRHPNKTAYWAIGIAGGIALASKQDIAPVLVAMYMGLALAPVFLRADRRFFWTNLTWLIGAGCITFAVFFAVMPVWWAWSVNAIILLALAVGLFDITAWWGRKLGSLQLWISVLILAAVSLTAPMAWVKSWQPIGLMIRVRQGLVAAQTGYRVASHLPYLPRTGDRLAYLLDRLIVSRPSYSERPPMFDDLAPVAEQIARYEASPLHGRNGLWGLDILVALLVCIGLSRAANVPNGVGPFLIILLGVSALILLLAVPLPFDRYFGILQVPYTLLAGLGLQDVWQRGQELHHARVVGILFP